MSKSLQSPRGEHEYRTHIGSISTKGVNPPESLHGARTRRGTKSVPPHMRRKANQPPTGTHTDAHSAAREGETKGKQPSALDPEQIIPIGEWAKPLSGQEDSHHEPGPLPGRPKRAWRTTHAQASNAKARGQTAERSHNHQHPAHKGSGVAIHMEMDTMST